MGSRKRDTAIDKAKDSDSDSDGIHLPSRIFKGGYKALGRLGGIVDARAPAKAQAGAEDLRKEEKQIRRSDLTKKLKQQVYEFRDYYSENKEECVCCFLLGVCFSLCLRLLLSF